jgi:hypothetical protein
VILNGVSRFSVSRMWHTGGRWDRDALAVLNRL